MDFSRLAFEREWEQCFSLIDNWKSTMIEQILNIYQEKSLEIQMYKEQAEKDLYFDKMNLILNMNEYFQHSSILSYEIVLFKNKLNQLKQNILHRPLPLRIEIESCSLDQAIQIRRLFDERLLNHRKILSQFTLYAQPIHLMAASKHKIIIINKQLHIFLYDRNIGFINEINMFDYTNEYLNDVCWSKVYKAFLFLCNYSLWSLENLRLNKLAHVPNKKHLLTNLTCFHKYCYIVYDHGEFIDRWLIQSEWKLDKRWIKCHKNDICLSIDSNNVYLLFYTNRSIQLCSEDLIIQYSIDLSHQEHIYSDFIFVPSYQVWLFVDKQTQLLKYFCCNDRAIQTLEKICVIMMSNMGDNEIALVTNDDYHLQIVSI